MAFYQLDNKRIEIAVHKIFIQSASADSSAHLSCLSANSGKGCSDFTARVRLSAEMHKQNKRFNGTGLSLAELKSNSLDQLQAEEKRRELFHHNTPEWRFEVPE